eukprot:561134-Amphidinium_carterae.1
MGGGPETDPTFKRQRKKCIEPKWVGYICGGCSWVLNKAFSSSIVRCTRLDSAVSTHMNKALAALSASTADLDGFLGLLAGLVAGFGSDGNASLEVLITWSRHWTNCSFSASLSRCEREDVFQRLRLGPLFCELCIDVFDDLPACEL